MNAVISRMLKPVAVLVLASLLVSALAMAFPLGVVSAAGYSQDPQPPTGDPANQPAPDPARLEKLYQRELRHLEGQANRLERADEMVARAEERIAELKANGKDTTALEEALAAFQEQLEEARATHEEAAQILKAHKGFDADGKVTDAAAAKETLKEAGKALRDTAKILRISVREILRALRQFRRDNQ